MPEDQTRFWNRRRYNLVVGGLVSGALAAVVHMSGASTNKATDDDDFWAVFWLVVQITLFVGAVAMLLISIRPAKDDN